MEQVFPVEINVSASWVNLNSGRASKFSSGFKEGVVEKILEPGTFIITLVDGQRVKVLGSRLLKIGNKVQVQLELTRVRGPETLSATSQPKSPDEKGLQLSALFPLGFGGKDAKARLEVFVERQSGKTWEKVVPAVYFVFEVQTKELGEIQWSVYIKGRQVALQVFARFIDELKKGLSDLVQEVEKSLRKRGFVMTTPTVYLSRPFKVPTGFRINVRG